jgi:hypothetical protein
VRCIGIFVWLVLCGKPCRDGVYKEVAVFLGIFALALVHKLIVVPTLRDCGVNIAAIVEGVGESGGKILQKRIVSAALGYLNTAQGLPRKDLECFFDVVAITFENGQANVEWIPQAFIPLYI